MRLTQITPISENNEKKKNNPHHDDRISTFFLILIHNFFLKYNTSDALATSVLYI